MNAKRNFTIKFWDPHVFLEQERLGISNSVCRRMPTHTNLWIKMNSDPPNGAWHFRTLWLLFWNGQISTSNMVHALITESTSQCMI